jgi:penicillin-insensitive murein endopeptidase
MKYVFLVAIFFAAHSASAVSLSFEQLVEDRDRELGPWLELRTGGQSIGPAQTRVVKNPDGTTTNVYGSLENATQLANIGPGIRTLTWSREENWGAGHMISLLERASEAFTRDYYPDNIVYVGDISRQNGGYFYPPHRSHQNGLDADLVYMGQTTFRSVLDKDGNVTERFDRARNWQYWRLLVSQQILRQGRPVPVVSMILVGPRLKADLCRWTKENDMLKDPLNIAVMKRVRPTEGHDDHFHLRLHCSPYHARCLWQGAYDDLGCDAAPSAHGLADHS